MTPEALIRDRAPATIRITRTDHSRVVVHRPVVEGDSVAGLLSRDEPKDGAAAPITISLNAIESVAIRRFDVLKTVGVVLLVDLAWCAATQCLADPGIP